MKREKRFIVFASFLLILTTAFVLWLSVDSKISAMEYMKLNATERKSYAEERYNVFEKNPKDYNDVLITTKHKRINYIFDKLPEDCEIISVYHCFTYNGRTMTGAYFDCKSKGKNEIQSAYYDEIHQLVLGAIDNNKKRLREINGQFLEDYSDDLPISVVERSNDEEELLRDLESKLKYYEAQLNDLEENNLQIYGLRIVAKNIDLEKLTHDPDVKIIEIMNFDNNDIVTPLY